MVRLKEIIQRVSVPRELCDKRVRSAARGDDLLYFSYFSLSLYSTTPILTVDCAFSIF